MIDSRPETYKHIQTVQRLVGRCIRNLLSRAESHDQSKLSTPEVEILDEHTPKLAGLTYGSPEYKAGLAAMRPMIDHHQSHNSHHPEFYRWHCAGCNGSFSADQAPVTNVGNGSRRWCPDCCRGGSVIWECELLAKPEKGILGMTLLDLTEMLCDWKAATLRHDDGDIRRSIEINRVRFGMSDDLARILLNTLSEIEGDAP